MKNIELWLSGAGLLVVWAASVLTANTGIGVWKIAALTALAVSVLHGVIFWVVRRRQRRVREQAILEIKEMLADMVKNQLAVIGMWIPTGDDRTLYDTQLEGIHESIHSIEHLVDGLSEEALHTWKAKYEEAVANCTELEPA